MTEDEILQRIVDGFISPTDVCEVAVLAIMAVQGAVKEVDHCGCHACLLYEKVIDLGFTRYDSDES